MNNLKKLRKDNKLLQEDIAKIINISRAGYTMYETEKRDIPTKVLHTLADYYNTSIDYILCRTNQTEPYPKNKT